GRAWWLPSVLPAPIRPTCSWCASTAVPTSWRVTSRCGGCSRWVGGAPAWPFWASAVAKTAAAWASSGHDGTCAAGALGGPFAVARAGAAVAAHRELSHQGEARRRRAHARRRGDAALAQRRGRAHARALVPPVHERFQKPDHGHVVSARAGPG